VSAGRDVAEYLRRQLHHNVEKVLREAGDRGVEECLRAAFLMTGASADLHAKARAFRGLVVPHGHARVCLCLYLGL
jgi:hypothetical protein